MMKRTMLITLLLAAPLLTGCATRSNQQYYEQAQLYLGAGKCDYAAELFSQLGEYEDSADYALYAAALSALDAGDTALARVNLEAIHPFKSSARYLTYLAALEAEQSGDADTAMQLWRSLGSFEDSRLQADRLAEETAARVMGEARALMAEGDYAAARELFLSLDGYGQSAAFAENCLTALNKQRYTAADETADAGDAIGAYHAFLALGDVLDAPERAADCLADAHSRLQEQLSALTLESAPALMADCEALGTPEALAIRQEAESRVGRNLQVLAMADQQPCVLLGAYPMGESGVESALLWRVIRAEGTAVTLLCETVIDAADAATPADLTLSGAEAQAVTASTLPSAADLASLTDLNCAATPYAAAQGVTQSDGLAVYWLRDSLEGGIHPVVSGGSLVIPADEAVPGVRPLITLNLDAYTFTAGSGAPEDPFR